MDGDSSMHEHGLGIHDAEHGRQHHSQEWVGGQKEGRGMSEAGISGHDVHGIAVVYFYTVSSGASQQAYVSHVVAGLVKQLRVFPVVDKRQRDGGQPENLFPLVARSAQERTERGQQRFHIPPAWEGDRE